VSDVIGIAFILQTILQKFLDQNKRNWHVQNELWFQANKKED
jgi:hypothetical protein